MIDIEAPVLGAKDLLHMLKDNDRYSSTGYRYKWLVAHVVFVNLCVIRAKRENTSLCS